LTKRYVIIKYDSKTPRDVRNKLTKVLRGNTVSINGRKYRSKGLIYKRGGIALCPGTFLIPIEGLKEFLNELERLKLRDFIKVKKACICGCG